MIDQEVPAILGSRRELPTTGPRLSRGKDPASCDIHIFGNPSPSREWRVS
jgi:hypothetical protein